MGDRGCAQRQTQQRKGEFVAKEQVGGLQMESYYVGAVARGFWLKPPSRTLAEGRPDITGEGGGRGRGTPSDIRGDQTWRVTVPG